MIAKRTRLKSALNTDIDPRLLELAYKRADQERVGLRVIIEKAISTYLEKDGIPPAIAGSIERIEAHIAMIAAQIEPLTAFVATVKYRDARHPERRVASHDDEEWRL